MSQPHRSSSMLRSIGAIVAGLVAIFVLSLGTDVALHALGVYAPWGQPISDKLALLATAYRIVYAVVGSYIAARLAPGKSMQHALVLGGIGIVLSALGAAATWNHVPSLGPHWYSVVLILISLPCAWLGGKMVREQAADSTDKNNLTSASGRP